MKEIASFFRNIAFEIDQNPDAIMNYMSHPAIEKLVTSEQLNCLDKAKQYEALGYGDAGVFLACPGASLAGMMLDELGDPSQQNLFHQHISSTKARTFLAVTEPQIGSNVRQIKTRLHSVSSQWFLTGEKWLVGHAATGSIGVVIVKVNDGPLGIRSILLTPEILNHQNTTIQRMVLPMVGLKGARLGRLKFNNTPIPHECLLGAHLNVAERGMMALIKTFNRMRPCIGALSVGSAQAIVDYLDEHLASPNQQIDYLNQILNVARELVYQAAIHVEKNPFDSSLSSLAKVKATSTAEKVAHAISTIIGKYAFIEHPFLEKSYRDIWGFEYMEGTQNMHKMNIYNAYQRGVNHAHEVQNQLF